MVSVTRRIDKDTIFVKGHYAKRCKDGRYGGKQFREDLELMNELVRFLIAENETPKGIYYAQMNNLFEQNRIDGCLCLAL